MPNLEPIQIIISPELQAFVQDCMPGDAPSAKEEWENFVKNVVETLFDQ